MRRMVWFGRAVKLVPACVPRLCEPCSMRVEHPPRPPQNISFRLTKGRGIFCPSVAAILPPISCLGIQAMSGSPLHRKSRRSYNDPGHAHFVTYSCRNRWPLLSTDRSRRWVLQAMEQTRTRLGIAICACVIMPEHVHMLLVPQNEHDEMRQVLASLKAPVARAAKAHLERTSNHAWLSQLTTSHGARKTFRFWQPGGGYDKNLWQTRSIEEVIAYIPANPVRRGLAERPAAWPWSSAQNYDGVAVGPFAIDRIELR